MRPNVSHPVNNLGTNEVYRKFCSRNALKNLCKTIQKRPTTSYNTKIGETC